MGTQDKGVFPMGTAALTHDVLAAMAEKERNFWNELNGLATEEIMAHKAAGKKVLFKPSEKLKGLFLEAKTKPGGMEYCQIQQLARIFEF